MITITRAEYERRIAEYIATEFPNAIRVTFDGTVVLSEDEYVEDDCAA